MQTEHSAASPVNTPALNPSESSTHCPRFDVITLFPEAFPGLVSLGVVGRALRQGRLELHCWNPRDFTTDAHKTIDDRPYGGGPGMVMMAEPLAKTLAAIRKERTVQLDGVVDETPLVFMTPNGVLLKQHHIRRMAGLSSESPPGNNAAIGPIDGQQQATLFDGAGHAFPRGLVFLCGRYEGVDERFLEAHVDHRFCLGDFILSGGELPVACFIDAWVRLLPGVLNHELSAINESFEQPLLDHPHYTRPDVYDGKSVPPVLLSGNHAIIEGWRKEQALNATRAIRPDLLDLPKSV